MKLEFPKIKNPFTKTLGNKTTNTKNNTTKSNMNNNMKGNTKNNDVKKPKRRRRAHLILTVPRRVKKEYEIAASYLGMDVTEIQRLALDNMVNLYIRVKSQQEKLDKS